MKIVFARHCQTDWNVQIRVQGQSDRPLNEHGTNQAKSLAVSLAGLGITRILTSDLLRAVQTAMIIADSLQVPVQTDERLRECSFGQLEGLTRVEILKSFDQDIHLPPPNSYDFQAYGGETWHEVLNRQLEALEEHGPKSDDDLPLVIGHGRSLSTLLFHLDHHSSIYQGEFTVVPYRPLVRRRP